MLRLFFGFPLLSRAVEPSAGACNLANSSSFGRLFWGVRCERGCVLGRKTHGVSFELSTLNTDTLILKYLLHFDEGTYQRCQHNDRMLESVLLTWVKNWPRKLDVPKVPWAFRHPLTTCLTLEVPVRRTHARVIQTTNF